MLPTFSEIAANPLDDFRINANTTKFVQQRSVGNRVKGFSNIKEDSTDFLTFFQKLKPLIGDME